MHAFATGQILGDRRHDYLYRTLSRKDETQEILAFDSSDRLREEHDRLYDDRLLDLRHTVRKRLLYGIITGMIAAGITVSAIVLLSFFWCSSVSDGSVSAMPPWRWALSWSSPDRCED